MTVTEERELKLGAGPGFRIDDVPGERLAPRRMTSVYVDTADHRLATAGVTLRRRVEGGRGRWQLKLPHGQARLELEVPAPGRGRGRPAVPPAHLSDLVTAWTRGAELLTVATLRSHRQGVLVRDARGPVAEVVLDAVQVLDGRRAARQFREIEVELVGGDEADLTRIERTLRAAGAIDGDGRPKLLRALDITPPPPLAPPAPSAPAAEHLQAMIESQMRLIVAHDPGTRLGEDPEDLHRMRVAVRRLRAVLREAGPMLDPARVAPLRDELEWLGDELGTVRDLDVLRRWLGEEIATLDPADAPGGARLIRQLGLRRDAARAALLDALRSDRYVRLLDALDEAARRPGVVDGDTSLARIGREAFRRLRRAVRALGAEPSDEALHEVRIKAKRARHAAELAAPAVGKPAQRFVDRAKGLQDLLGELQDAVVAQGRIRELGGRARDPAAAFVAGRLVERQAARRAEILRQFPRRWRKLEKRGLKAWD